MNMIARAIACLTLLPALAAAEAVQWKEYTIYYNTFRSTLVPPQVASLHGITRADNRILTNITVRRDGEPVRAQVEGNTTNLLGQLRPLEFTEVIEEAAIYYLANQVVDERDTVRYRIRIRPASEDETFELTFERRYYGDGPGQ